MEQILFIDTETGGVFPKKHSLLSIGLVAWDTINGIKDTKEVYIKQKVYEVTNQAAKINGFTKEEQDSKGLASKKAIKEIFEFTDKNFNSVSKIVIGGHNVNFDISFLREFLEKNKISFEKRFSHRSLDTASVIRYLRIAKKISFSGGLTTALNNFDIKCKKRHGALADAIATARLFEYLIKIIDFH